MSALISLDDSDVLTGYFASLQWYNIGCTERK